VGQVVAAEWNGKGRAHLDVTDTVDAIGPGHHNLVGRHAEAAQLVDGFRRRQVRPCAPGRAVPGQGLRVEMVSVAVRHRVQIDRRQIRRSQRRRHRTVEVESARLSDRLAGIGQVGIDGDDFPRRTLENKARLSQPPQRDRACRNVVATEFMSRQQCHRLTFYGFGGEVAINTTSGSLPVFSIPWTHHGGRYTKSPFCTSRWKRAKVIRPRPSKIT